MLKNFRDKIAFSGMTVLVIGIALLIFSFISAYGFLTTTMSIVSSSDLTQAFGEALGPLIGAGIHVMYMGIMVWVGSILTVRGVTIITHIPQPSAEITNKQMAAEPKTQPQSQLQAQPLPQQQPPKQKVEKPKKEKPKEEKPREAAKPAESEITVIPPEEVAQPQP